MSSVQTAAVAAATLLGAVIVFQLALAAGAPWGRMAYGGRATQGDGTLSRRHRFASGMAALALTAAMWVVLAAGSVVSQGSVSDSALTITTWVLAVLFVMNTVGNLAGEHPMERWGAGTVAALLAGLCVVLALGS